MTKTAFLLLSLTLIMQACSTVWSEREKEIIAGQTPLRVLTIEDPNDSKILRDTCSSLTNKELLSDLYSELCAKMIATVTDPSQDGVGIAGPQIGLSRRIVAVQRLDKESEPFVVYPNIRIIAKRGEYVKASEACLSVPNRRGVVARSRDIDIQYSLVENGEVREIVETVQGFTAVIFQHECDHLDGIIYIDKLEEEE